MNIFELFGKMSIEGLDKTKEQLSGLEKHTQQVQKGMRIMGAAFTAAGVAGLAIIQSTKKINAQLGVTALNLGVTTAEMRDLTLATTNVTFPIDEVTKSFDLLARAGIKDMKVLKATATAFDTLGDAVGASASQVTAKMVPAMKTFGLSAGEVAGKTDKMTYLVRNTTVSLDNFGSVIGYITPELVDMGLTLDDTIALMALMEERGMSGEVATRAFRTAITQATKEQIPLNEALGITSQEMAEYQKKLEGATGMTQEYADVANEQYTLMDKLRQKWSELTLKASAFLEPLEPILAGMTALGPLMIGLSTKAGTAAIMWGLHTASLVAHKIAAYASAAANWVLHASLGPIGWALIALAAAAAIAIPWIRGIGDAASQASKAAFDLKRSLFESQIALMEATPEWAAATEQGYLTGEQFASLAEKLGLTTSELMILLKEMDILTTVQWEAGEAIRYNVQNLEDLTDKTHDQVAANLELTASQESLNRGWEDFQRNIQASTKAFGDYGLTSEDVIRYLAQTQGGIDAVIESLKEQGIAANDVRYYLDELGISAKDVADFVGKKKRAVIEETEADIEAAGAASALSDVLHELGEAPIGFPSGFGFPSVTGYPPEIGRPGEGYVAPELPSPEVSPFVIQIDGMTIREEADIYRVAEELYRLRQDKVRATGG